MFKQIKITVLNVQAGVLVWFLAGAQDAHATTISGSGNNNFSDIARNITTSISELPGLITAIGYLMGILLGVLGILKLKDHVENPTQTPLKDGAIRLASGGALFAFPMVTEAMLNTIGSGRAVGVPRLNAVEFRVN